MTRSPFSRLLPFLFLAVALVLHWRLAIEPSGAIGGDQLLDTDSYARLMRVEQLWAGTGWYDSTLDRLGAPEGMSIHWTRPLDLLILGPAVVAHAVGASMDRAIWWSGMFICPILHALACLVIVWGARAMWSPAVAWFAGIFMLAQPTVIAYGSVGRADHHVLILLFVAGCLAAGLWAVKDLRNHRAAWLAGLCAGGGVWVGPEAQLVIVPVLAGFGALWAFSAGDNAAIARQGLRIALGFAGATIVAVGVDVQPRAWLITAYDRISVLHVATALLLAAIFAGAALLDGGPVRRRLVLGFGLSAAALAVLAVLFPGFERSTLATDDPAIQAYLAQIREMQPIRFWTRSGFGDLLLDMGGLILAVFFAPLALIGAPDAAARRVVIVWTITLAATLVAALAFLRFVVEFAAPAAIGVAGLLGVTGAALANARPLGRVLAILAIALLATIALPIIGTRFRDAPVPATCGAADLAAYLRATPPVSPGTDGRDPIVMMSNFNLTPRLAFDTPFRFIAAPYHRGAGALRDTLDFFGASDDQAAKAILDRRTVSLVIVCRSGSVPRIRDEQPGSLGARLVSGQHTPVYLSAVPLPEVVSRAVAIYRVQK